MGVRWDILGTKNVLFGDAVIDVRGVSFGEAAVDRCCAVGADQLVFPIQGKLTNALHLHKMKSF